MPRAEYERIAPHLELVEPPSGHILYQAEGVMEHVYFPTSMMISLIAQTIEGESVEVGVVGFEGMAGLPLILRVDKSPHETMVQIPGAAWRLSADVLLEEFKRGGALQASLLRYTQALLLLTAQLAACNRLHTVVERLARWLLMSHDRCVCEELPLTQEFLALMLGTRRAGVSEAAAALHIEGYIDYRRGHIKITDRTGLNDFACDCYRIVKEEFDRITAENRSSAP